MIKLLNVEDDHVCHRPLLYISKVNVPKVYLWTGMTTISLFNLDIFIFFSVSLQLNVLQSRPASSGKLSLDQFFFSFYINFQFVVDQLLTIVKLLLVSKPLIVVYKRKHHHFIPVHHHHYSLDDV